MTTSHQEKRYFFSDKSIGPENWSFKYSVNDGTNHVLVGFPTLSVALREIRILERQHLPSTITNIELLREQ